ncbi:MAG: OmpA family protein [Ghiorsea sp.]|nr:OmpA family protein [Ghiorsea sp.]
MLRLLIILLLFAPLAHAATYAEMNQQVNDFETSGQARFAPKTMKRVQAFQGASMLAHEQSRGFSNSNPAYSLTQAIDKTLQTLEVAKSNALIFQQTFPALLQQEAEANKALVYHHKPQVLPEETVRNFFNDAQVQMNIAIRNTENGHLNLARQAAAKSILLFQKCIDSAMPGLIEQSERALDQASSVGAKKYAPRTYTIAKEALESLEAYNSDIQKAQAEREPIPRPTRIGYAMEMAIFAQKIAIKVKSWKRDQGSYEKLTLKARDNRLLLAKAMKVPLDYDQVEVDIQADELLKHVQQLLQTLEQERRQHQQAIALLQKNFDDQLKQRLHKQRLEDQKSFQSQVGKMKSAFNSKLARQTFEKNRQQQIRDLFTANEVEIITKLEGSLMIRVKNLQFGSNSSQVDGQYFDLLGRIKEALDLYPARNIIIEGHTDSTGNAQDNRQLSLSRAESVLEFLIASGIDAERIKALGYGEAKPIATNMYKKGRAMNRRIDIIIQAPE